jgi:hypothetical protein
MSKPPDAIETVVMGIFTPVGLIVGAVFVLIGWMVGVDGDGGAGLFVVYLLVAGGAGYRSWSGGGRRHDPYNVDNDDIYR